MSAALPFDHARYFEPEPGALTVALDRLQPTKPLAALEASSRTAAERMQDAAHGRIPRRRPLAVRPVGNKFAIVDGNSTYLAALRAGWASVRVALASGPWAPGQPGGRTLRILAIDGGGIRGIIPAVFLAKLEAEADRPICQLFDLVAGTSTGGLIALGLTVAADDGTPAYSAGDVVRLYEQRGDAIFARGARHRVRSAFGLVASKYPGQAIDTVLAEFFGERTLTSALTDVMVPAYDIEQRSRYWFKARKARAQADDDALLRDVARATTAAPTYFPPARIERTLRYRALVDGGVYANNPALATYVEACSYYETSDVLVVSLGTGELTRALPLDRSRGWGVARWARPILDVVFDGVGAETHHNLRKLLPGDRYLRVQAQLYAASDAMDDVSPRNIQLLKVQGDQLAFEHRDAIAGLIPRLTAA